MSHEPASDAAPGDYRIRDIFRVPGLLSLSRLLLAAAFPFAVENPPVAFAILVLAGLSDVLDGWAARRLNQVTATGAALDPVTDKLFVLTIAITLVVTGHLTVTEVALLSTREIGELPLVLWFAVSARARRARARKPAANLAGKIATVLAFVAVGSSLLRAPLADVWVAAAAVAGAWAAYGYWKRALALV